MFTEEDSTTIDIEHGKELKKKYKNYLNFVTFKKL